MYLPEQKFDYVFHYNDNNKIVEHIIEERVMELILMRTFQTRAVKGLGLGRYFISSAYQNTERAYFGKLPTRHSQCCGYND
jgi:hypothetical protein